MRINQIYLVLADEARIIATGFTVKDFQEKISSVIRKTSESNEIEFKKAVWQ